MTLRTKRVQNGSFIKRHMCDARLLHIENLKYSQNCEGGTGFMG